MSLRISGQHSIRILWRYWCRISQRDSFQRGNYLDAITQINTVVFDKTGTLTQGVFSVQAISAAEGVSQKELLQLIASIESFSNHPIAKAIVKYAEEQNISL